MVRPYEQTPDAMKDEIPTVSPDDVLSFWFDGAAAGTASPETVARWFRSDPAFDDAIRRQFGPAIEAAIDGALDHWQSEPESWLALLIVLDQFPRNVSRGTAAAFAGDARAQRIARAGIDAGLDRALTPLQRVFAYLPLEHAEDASLQAQCVALFDALRSDIGDAQRPMFDMFHDYAVRHREVIDRFGRFPHRNAALGRSSTPAERDYLATPGAGF